MKKIILAALALVPALALATPGAYVQLQGGGNWVDTGTSGVSSFTGASGGVGIGYLWGDTSVDYGLELNGIIYPNSTTSNSGVDYKVNGYNISLLAVLKYIDCASGFVAFAKAGATYVTQKLTVNIPGIGEVSSNTFTKTAPEGDLGIGYKFDPNWEVDLTGNYVYTNNTTVGNNANILLGVTYNFA